jgi:flavin reductase (DIM6/NTAB) family NADH-FMN oxidoreductase RutF
LDYEPTSQVLFVCDTGHRTLANIKETAIFALALPTWRQLELVEKAGSVSGREGDKYARLGIPAFAAQTAGLRIPEGVAGWLECRLLDLIDRRTACVVCGEVSAARAVDKAWMERLHMGGDGWYRPEPLTPDQTGAGGR